MKDPDLIYVYVHQANMCTRYVHLFIGATSSDVYSALLLYMTQLFHIRYYISIF
jgi:hypothetical protein